MPSFICPIEICLESLEPDMGDAPYIRCVAVARGTPGLGIGRQGQIVWCDKEQALAEIWVCSEAQVNLSQRGDSASIQVLNGKRHLEVTQGKPVTLLDGDVLSVEGYSFRVHIYGLANTITAPERLSLERTGLFVTEATMLALSIAG